RQLRGTPKTGGAADQWFIDALPKLRRPHERLVVESGSKQRATPRGQRLHIKAQRRPAILSSRLQSLEQFDRRRLSIGFAASAAAQFNKPVGLLGTGRQQAARAMIFE